MPVAGFDRKTMVLLTAALWLGGMALVCPLPAAQDDSPAVQPDGSQSVPVPADKTDSLFAPDPNFTGGTAYGLGRWELFIRTMLALVFLIILGVGAFYVSKRLLPKLANRPSKEIRVVETVHLGPRKAVHLIEVGNRRFLIGSTNENIRKLAEVTAGFPDLPEADIDLGSERI